MRSPLRLLVLLLLASTVLASSPRAQRAPSDPWLEAEPAASEAPAPFAGPSSSVVEYAYDDGAANVNIGPPSSFDPDMLWGNYFVTEPGGEVITEIAVAFGGTFPSLADGPVTFWLLDDPDVDFDPRNATALTSVQATPDVSGNEFFSVEIEPTEVSGAFFVGASAFLQGGEDRPARVDADARADRSWFFYAPNIAETIDSLGTAPFGTRMDDPTNVPFPGAFMIRATGVPNTTAGEPSAEPAAFALGAAYPNPFTQATTVPYELSVAGRVMMEVFDVTGRRVATLVDDVQAAGPHTATWTATGLAAGVYLGRMQVGDRVRTQRLVVLPTR